MKMTMKDLLQEMAERHQQRTFLFWEDEQISYGQLLERATKIAASLAERGYEKNDKIGVWAFNRPEYVYMAMACALSGTVLVPINTQLKPDEAHFILANSEAKALITEPPFVAMVDQFLNCCPGVQEVIVLDQDLPGTTNFDELYQPAGAIDRHIDEDDVVTMIYTSGATGHPKGVLLTNKNYVTNAGQIVEACRITKDDRFMCILPLFHVLAQVVSVMAPLSAGASMVLLDKFSPKDFLPKLERYRATAFSAVPTVYAILNNLPDAEQYDLSWLRFCICGAAPMPLEIFETFERRYKAYILEGYGLSEATCASSFNPLTGDRKLGSIGLTLPGQEMKIVDEQGQELPTGQVGEIVIRGDNVMAGYYENPDATAESLKDGWLYTGDLGHQDADGWFFIAGRKKEMIIRGGENVYPKEIEQVLMGHPKIADVAVVGIPDKIWGEEVAAFIVLENGRDMRNSEVLEHCKSRLADYKCPRMVFFWSRLPRNDYGRVMKDKIIEDYVRRSER